VQHARSLALLIPWLNYSLRSDSQAYVLFTARLDSLAAASALAFQLDCLDTASPGAPEATTLLTLLPGGSAVGTGCALRFVLAHPARVEAAVFDIAGRRVRSLLAGEERAAGVHGLIWDGAGKTGVRQPAGVYLLRVTAGHESRSRKFTLLR
jgi:hypothetical protein